MTLTLMKVGLIQQSLIRVGYLAIIPNKIIAGIIGKISVSRLQKIKKQLAEFIQRD